jgi:hypothetical protein
MDYALSEMPRSKHRLFIYRFRIMTKAKLGLDVQMDLQKFKEETENNLAQMYRKVALSSNTSSDIIIAYQRAIDTLNVNLNFYNKTVEIFSPNFVILKSEENQWLKFEYLIELAQWLYSNEYEFESCVDLVEWAIDIITNLKTVKPDLVTTSTQMTMSGASKRSKSKNLTFNDRSKSQQSLKPNKKSYKSEFQDELVTTMTEKNKEPTLSGKN